MGMIKRGGYVFRTWIGDHGPKHVHVYRNGVLIVKWNLENKMAMKGNATGTIVRLIAELCQEGRL